MSTTPPPAPSYDDLTGLRVTVGGAVARVAQTRGVERELGDLLDGFDSA